MSNSAPKTFADVPLWQSPIAGPVQDFVRRLTFWLSLSAPASELRDALTDIVNEAGKVLHTALASHGEDHHAGDLVRRADQLFRSADRYAGADEVGDCDSLEQLYVTVRRAVDGLIAWLEDTDYQLRPTLGPAAMAPKTSAAPLPPASEPAALVVAPSDPPPAGPVPTAVAADGAADAASSVRTILVDGRTATVEYCGIKVHLRFNLGFRILEFLAKHPGFYWEYSEVIEAVWGDTRVTDPVVDEHVSKLRMALRKQPENRQLWGDLALRIRRRQRRWQLDLNGPATDSFLNES